MPVPKVSVLERVDCICPINHNCSAARPQNSCFPDRQVIPSEDRILLSNLTSGSIFVSFGGMSTIGRLVIGSWWDHEISASNCARRKEENFWPRMRECFKKAAKIGPGLRLTFKRFNRERNFDEILQNRSLTAG